MGSRAAGSRSQLRARTESMSSRFWCRHLQLPQVAGPSDRGCLGGQPGVDRVYPWLVLLEDLGRGGALALAVEVATQSVLVDNLER